MRRRWPRASYKRNEIPVVKCLNKPVLLHIKDNTFTVPETTYINKRFDQSRCSKLFSANLSAIIERRYQEAMQIQKDALTLSEVLCPQTHTQCLNDWDALHTNLNSELNNTIKRMNSLLVEFILKYDIK